MSLTPIESIEFPITVASTLSDRLLSDILMYTKFNGMLLGYIAVVLTLRLLGRF